MRHATILTLLPLAAALACSDGTSPEPGVSLTFATRVPGATAAPGFFASVAAADTLVDGQNTLVITRAEIVLREIELKRVEVTDCDVVPEPDGCEKFEAGPILLDLPLNGTTETAVTIPVPAGSYNELEFEIHKVTNDQEDAAFRARYPHMADQSIRIEGTFNGQPFVYVTDLDVEQEFDLVPPMVIDENTMATNVTVRLDLSAWFRTGAGQLVNPQLGNKGGEYESLIKENIKQNIEAFEDHDRDGDDSDEG